MPENQRACVCNTAGYILMLVLDVSFNSNACHYLNILIVFIPFGFVGLLLLFCFHDQFFFLKSIFFFSSH